MADADSRAARAGGGTAAGSASRGAAWNVARRIAARDSVAAFGWTTVWRSGCGGSIGARNMVGAAAGVVQQDSGRDGGAEKLVSLDRDASELCGRQLSGARSNKTNFVSQRRI